MRRRVTRTPDKLPTDRQRIDKWLWHARIVRTRNAAAGLAHAGLVRLNGCRIDAASHPVRTGDVLTIALDRSVRVLKVVGFRDRRGSAIEARTLYQDIKDDHQPDGTPDPFRRQDEGHGV